MPRSGRAAFLVAIVAAVLGWWYLATRVPRGEHPTAGESLVMLGDSLVDGVGARPGRELPALVGDRIGSPIINAGQRGDTAAAALERLERDVLSRNPRVVVVLVGGNDFLRRVPREATFAALNTIVGRVRARGAGVVIVGLRLGLVTDQYGNLYEALARRTGSALVPDVLGGILGHGDLMSDQVHPNDRGYAMELRINAEKAEVGEQGTLTFVPCPGEVTVFRFPDAPGITLIRAVDQGKVVTPYYDSMIVQLIGHAPTRPEVIALLRQYLDSVEVRGISTNIPLLQAILDDAVFRNGEYDTTFLREFTARVDTAQLIASIDAAAGDVGSARDIDALRIPGTDEIRVLAPSAGIFYRTPAPGEPDFVRPGDVVDTERTLCLLEAMKLFRPLGLSAFQVFPAGSFEIVRIIPDTGQTVNRDDLLFIVRPAVATAAAALPAPDASE